MLTTVHIRVSIGISLGKVERGVTGTHAWPDVWGCGTTCTMPYVLHHPYRDNGV